MCCSVFASKRGRNIRFRSGGSSRCDYLSTSWAIAVYWCGKDSSAGLVQSQKDFCSDRSRIRSNTLSATNVHKRYRSSYGQVRGQQDLPDTPALRHALVGCLQACLEVQQRLPRPLGGPLKLSDRGGGGGSCWTWWTTGEGGARNFHPDARTHVARWGQDRSVCVCTV